MEHSDKGKPVRTEEVIETGRGKISGNPGIVPPGDIPLAFEPGNIFCPAFFPLRPMPESRLVLRRNTALPARSLQRKNILIQLHQGGKDAVGAGGKERIGIMGFTGLRFPDEILFYQNRYRPESESRGVRRNGYCDGVLFPVKSDVHILQQVLYRFFPFFTRTGSAFPAPEFSPAETIHNRFSQGYPAENFHFIGNLSAGESPRSYSAEPVFRFQSPVITGGLHLKRHRGFKPGFRGNEPNED
jgi:hypothetical protein